jgi:hypothetical protein
VLYCKEGIVEKFESMPMYVWWDDNTRTTLFYLFKGEWTLTDISAALEQRTALLDSVSHKVVTVVDLKGCFALPDNVVSFAMRVASQQHPNLDMTLIVSPDPIMDVTQVVLRKIAVEFGASMHFVKSLDEAYAFLAEYRRPWWDRPTLHARPLSRRSLHT